MLTAAQLGFTATAKGWRREVRGRALGFRRLRLRAEFEQAERLQREVFGVSDRDLASFSILVVIQKTGGEVLGAFDGERMVGFISAYGGYVAGGARLVSDMLAVDPAWRGGLGFAFKALQAAVAWEAGFPLIVWTVDPLRAANARLNFERLGATAHEYSRDVYGADFADGLYGGLPSDRLTVEWDLTDPHVADRLLGRSVPRKLGSLDALPEYAAPGPNQARVAIPADIDALLATDPPAALAWRYRVRAALEGAFAAGYGIDGFASASSGAWGNLLLAR